MLWYSNGTDNEHIRLVANKTVKTLGVMNKIKHFLTSTYLKKLIPVLN